MFRKAASTDESRSPCRCGRSPSLTCMPPHRDRA
jgi:hypothetical protein